MCAHKHRHVKWYRDVHLNPQVTQSLTKTLSDTVTNSKLDGKGRIKNECLYKDVITVKQNEKYSP